MSGTKFFKSSSAAAVAMAAVGTGLITLAAPAQAEDCSDWVFPDNIVGIGISTGDQLTFFGTAKMQRGRDLEQQQGLSRSHRRAHRRAELDHHELHRRQGHLPPRRRHQLGRVCFGQRHGHPRRHLLLARQVSSATFRQQRPRRPPRGRPPLQPNHRGPARYRLGSQRSGVAVHLHGRQVSTAVSDWAQMRPPSSTSFRRFRSSGTGL